MKKFFLKFGALLLLVVALLLWSPLVALAGPGDAAPPAANDATATPSATPGTSGFGKSIPDTFNVNQLQAPGQKSYVPGKEIPDPTHSGVVSILVNVISLFVKIISSISLIVFIIGALLVITSEGKEDVLEKGKSAMLYSVIGIVVALLSFVIVTFVRSVFY